MTKICKDILETVGSTPLIQLNRMPEKGSARILAKIEYFNPGGSVKDRIALSMVESAEEKGLITEGATIIEPTSGNTGIGLAMVAAVKGYKCILTMPETMSIERRSILAAYGVEIVLTPGIEGMTGAIKKAEEIQKSTPNSFLPQQFKNDANVEAHRKHTALEILDSTEGKIDAFVAGVGTGGTITGVGEVLKEKAPDVKIVAVEPKTSAVLSGEEAGPNRIQGIGAGFIPEILNRDVITDIKAVDDVVAYDLSKRLAVEEGIFVGISSGAALSAALEVAKELGEGKTVVVVFPDTGERYFSMDSVFK